MRQILTTILLLAASLTVVVAQNANPPQKVDVQGDNNYENGPGLHYDGIDVSSYQKDIDWTTTAADKNIKFVFVKATEGKTHQSRHYRRNIEHARKQGVKVGSYHFLRTTSSIDDQFANFTQVVKLEEQDIIPLIDVETRSGWTNKQLQDSVKKFADLIEAHYGVRPMIYTSSSFFNNYLGPDFAKYPLFIARYSKSEPQLNYGAKWILWQFSDRGRIQGIDAYVDLCRFNKGCNVNNLLIGKKGNRSTRGNTVPQTVPEPKKKQNAAKPDVPKSKKQQKDEEKRRREEQKKADKQAKQQQKEQEKAQKKAKKQQKQDVPQQQKPKTQPKQNVPANKNSANDNKTKPDNNNNQASGNNNANNPPTTTGKPAVKKNGNQGSADNDKENYSTRRNRQKK